MIEFSLSGAVVLGFRCFACMEFRGSNNGVFDIG